MSGKFISIIIAASIAVTGITASPAQADERDLARALAAIVGVAVIGAAVQDSRNDKRYAAPQKYRKQKFQKQKKHRRAEQRRAYQQPYAYQPRHPAVERAYRQGVRDQRRAVRERHTERRSDRRYGYGEQRGYSARAYGYGH